LAYGMQS